MENMSKRLDKILDGQKKLEETNAVLQEENAKLKNQLSRLEATKRVNKRSRSARTDSSVDIPNDLRVSECSLLP